MMMLQGILQAYKRILMMLEGALVCIPGNSDGDSDDALRCSYGHTRLFNDVQSGPLQAY